MCAIQTTCPYGLQITLTVKLDSTDRRENQLKSKKKKKAGFSMSFFFLFHGAEHFWFVFKEKGAGCFEGGMQQHAELPGSSSTEHFPLPVNAERNIRLLFAKAAVGETTQYVMFKNTKRTFLMKIVTTSIVDISY